MGVKNSRKRGETDQITEVHKETEDVIIMTS